MKVTKQIKVQEFLRGLLSQHDLPQSEIVRLAAEQQISERTLNRAKAALGIISIRTQPGEGGGHSEWRWGLPTPDTFRDQESDGAADLANLQQQYLYHSQEMARIGKRLTELQQELPQPTAPAADSESEEQVFAKVSKTMFREHPLGGSHGIADVENNHLTLVKMRSLSISSERIHEIVSNVFLDLTDTEFETWLQYLALHNLGDTIAVLEAKVQEFKSIGIRPDESSFYRSILSRIDRCRAKLAT
jgi:hypothetical protein